MGRYLYCLGYFMSSTQVAVLLGEKDFHDQFAAKVPNKSTANWFFGVLCSSTVAATGFGVVESHGLKNDGGSITND